jgi:hypothetical protein
MEGLEGSNENDSEDEDGKSAEDGEGNKDGEKMKTRIIMGMAMKMAKVWKIITMKVAVITGSLREGG